ncbi:hypothetical protein Tco_0923329 [Tanacetum coccineum]|uniref:Uncharacterized protein n=1 Tax=Tanacetum coccineum TaxID=301880 RepID=A0ABQ5D0N5_9ASTR
MDMMSRFFSNDEIIEDYRWALHDHRDHDHSQWSVSRFHVHIEFDCLLDINEQICPRFILEFYSQYHVNYTPDRFYIVFNRRGQSFTASSSAFGQPSSSHPIDDDNDGNDEGISCTSTSSPTRFVNSLPNNIPQVFSNPPNIDPNMEPFYTRQTEILNRKLQLRDEQRGGIRSIEKGIKNLWRKKKK